MPEFGSLKRIDLRGVWSKEVAEFTPWLAENLTSLGEALGMELGLESREAAVGAFSCDLVARDLGSNRLVVIENQLSPTDHDHLGKLITYASGFDAGVVVWIAPEIRDEHRQALDWLNQRTDVNVDFFGVLVEVLQIDDSRPAFRFRPVAFPNQWRKDTVSATATGRPSERAKAYRAFFQELIDELRERHKFTGARVAQPQSWYSFSSGVSGVNYSFSFRSGKPGPRRGLHRHGRAGQQQGAVRRAGERESASGAAVRRGADVGATRPSPGLPYRDLSAWPCRRARDLA